MDRAAAAVAEHLDLDVARLLQVFFQIDRGVAERRLGLVGGGRQRQHQIVGGLRDLHAASAAAGGRLDQHRKADRSAAIAIASSSGPTAPSEPGTTGMPSFLAVFLASILSPIRRMCSAFGPMKMQIVVGEDFGKAGVLRQKAVAGMHRVGAGDLAGREQRGHVEIAVLRRRRPDADALVGEPHMHGVGVGGRMHRDGGDAELLAGAQDAQRDLAAIGYEDLVEHVPGRVANGE